MKTILIKGAKVVNEDSIKQLDVLIVGKYIGETEKNITPQNGWEVIDAKGMFLLPGMIDDQVHFREPGVTYKADIHSESRAAIAGGITSFMEMPNTRPNTVTQKLLQDKYDIAAKNSLANYSFFMGATNDNLEEVLKTDPKTVCGVKVFMGSSTGNMLVDDTETLENLFSKYKGLIATHCEDEETIKRNSETARKKYGEDVPIRLHPEIRSSEACYLSSAKAVGLAKKHDARLHILHLSTAKELELFDNKLPLSKKRITAEACIHHLWFTDKDYDEKGTMIKWNPAVKSEADRNALIEAVNNNTIDIIATDHAPHTLEEKKNTYFNAPSGGPLVQHALPALFDMYFAEKLTLEKIVEKTSHRVAQLFQIEKRGFIRKGYYADLVLIDPNSPWKVELGNILYKCQWSPFEGHTFKAKVKHTFVNGNHVFKDGKIDESHKGMRLMFER
jgi:dihydroorotase